MAKLYPNNPAIIHHLAQHQFTQVVSDDLPTQSPELIALLRVLMAPVVESYRVAAQMVAEGKSGIAPQEVVRQKHQVHLPFVENAFSFLLSEGLLAQDEEGRFLIGSEAERAIHLRDAFVLSEKTLWMMPAGEA